MVTPEALETLVHANGWRLEWQKRHQTRYAYAVRGSRKNRLKRYLCGEHELPEMEEEKKQKIETRLQ